MRQLLKRKKDLTKLIKAKETTTTNTTNSNQTETSDNTSLTHTHNDMGSQISVSPSKQIKLETSITTESTNSYDPELHTELIIDEADSIKHEITTEASSAPDPLCPPKSAETAQEVVARAFLESRSRRPLTPAQAFVATALQEGILHMEKAPNTTTMDSTDKPATDTTMPQHTDAPAADRPAFLRLRPIDQLLAAVNVVENTPTTQSTPQPSQDMAGEIIQQSVLNQVDQTIDRLTQFIIQPFDGSLPLLDNNIYQRQIEAEMRRRTACLADQALRFEVLRNIQFLKIFEHLQPDINLSYRINQEFLINHKTPVTHIERTQYDQYKGFMFQKQVEGRLVHIEDKKKIVDTPVPEYSTQAPTMYLTDTHCTHCKVGHKAGTAPCHGTSFLTNMTKETLRTDHSWRDTTKAVVISNRALAKLPIVLKDEVINIQIPHTLSYWAGRGHTGQDDTTSSFYIEIMEILQLIGAECTYLVFIEYMKPYNSRNAPEYHHLAFVRTCRELQTHYGGLIIPVLGLYKPNRGENTARYLESKYRLATCFSGAFAVGRWLGIVVDIPNIQNGVASRETQRKFSPSWLNEPLFNSNAEPTREWYRRIAIYFMARIGWFRPYYPMADRHSRRIKLATPSYIAKSMAFP